MQRIYLPKINFSDTLILSEEAIYHQLTRVLRSRVWNTFIFFDGENLNFCIYRSDRSQELRISDSKQQRLEKIIKEAVEQSNRNIIPKLRILDEMNFDIVSGEDFYLHTSSQGSLNLKDIQISSQESLNIWVGPEGGFSDQEIQNFNERSFKKLYLGDSF